MLPNLQTEASKRKGALQLRRKSPPFLRGFFFFFVVLSSLLRRSSRKLSPQPRSLLLLCCYKIRPQLLLLQLKSQNRSSFQIAFPHFMSKSHLEQNLNCPCLILGMLANIFGGSKAHSVAHIGMSMDIIHIYFKEPDTSYCGHIEAFFVAKLGWMPCSIFFRY